MKAMIHSVKHLVQFPFNNISTGTIINNILAFCKERTASNDANEVVEGSTIKAVYIELWLQNSANDGHQIVTVEKKTSGASAMTFAEQAALFDYDNKKNVLFTHQGLSSNDGVGNPQNILRQWIKIPKSKQRFGLGDALYLNISNPSSNNLAQCGIAIYKEYS